MNSKEETITKFLEALNIDTIGDVKYDEKLCGRLRCVCGQPIKNGYLFTNKRNHLQCVVGKNCLPHITWYLNWD